jgi:hypothetical protein
LIANTYSLALALGILRIFATLASTIAIALSELRVRRTPEALALALALGELGARCQQMAHARS